MSRPYTFGSYPEHTLGVVDVVLGALKMQDMKIQLATS